MTCTGTSVMWFMLATAWVFAQEPKPPDAGKKAVATKPFNTSLFGQSATLQIPATWAAVTPLPAAPLKGWKCAGAWKSAKVELLTFLLLGAEHAGLTAPKARDAWLAESSKGGTQSWLVMTDVKDKQTSGCDMDVEIDRGDGIKSWSWLRTLPAGRDRVYVLLAEASPYDPRKLETMVLEIGPDLDSFQRKTANPADPWQRGPKVEVSQIGARATVDAPQGWTYSRLAPEGFLIWMHPDASGREYILGFFPFGAAGADMFIEAQTLLATRSGGEVLKNEPIPGEPMGRDMIYTSTLDRRLWQRRLMVPRREVIISFLAKVPLGEKDAFPSLQVLKEVEAILCSLKVGS